MKEFHPITGPVPPAEFAALVNAPYGKAKKIIRKYDPLWGVPDGQKISWRVEATATCEGIAHVEAASKEEAEILADDLGAAHFDWEPVRHSAITIETVEPDEP